MRTGKGADSHIVSEMEASPPVTVRLREGVLVRGCLCNASGAVTLGSKGS